jgi:hypothetical protein
MGVLRVSVAAAVVSFALVGGAEAAQLKIVDVKAYAFLEHAGKLSDDLVGSGESIVDAQKGGALGGDTATGLLIDLTQTGRSGQPIITHRAFTNFIFGPDGTEHKAVFLEAATCMPLAIQVHAGKTEKTAKIDFHCTETVAPR